MFAKAHPYRPAAALATLCAVLTLPAALGADDTNRSLSEEVTVVHAGVATDGSDLYQLTAEIAIATASEEFVSFGTFATLTRNGAEVTTKSFNVLSNGGGSMAACGGAVAEPGDPGSCRAASTCGTFFGEELAAACELREGFGRPARCGCTARVAANFFFVPLALGDDLALRVGASPASPVPERHRADDEIRFRFTGEGRPACVQSGKSLCLHDGRFRAQVRFTDFDGDSGPGWAVPASSASGSFWFFRADHMELAVKVVDGRKRNAFWWVFLGALTNVEYTLTVTDTATGAVRSYFNPAGELRSAVDVEAFAD